MKSTVVISVVIRYHKKTVWYVIRGFHMKESNTLTTNATMEQLQSLTLLDTKVQYMKAMQVSSIFKAKSC